MTKKSNEQNLMAAAAYFHGRHVTEQEILAYSGLSHGTLVATRKKLHEQGYLDYYRDGRGMRYVVTEEGWSLLPADTPIEHTPSFHDDMPHITGHYFDFAEWAETVMDYLTDDVYFKGVKGHPNLVCVYSGVFMREDYYNVVQNADESVDVK